MGIAKLLLLIILAVLSNCQAFKISEKSLCIACRAVTNKIAVAVRKDHTLRYDLSDLRNHILSNSEAKDTLGVNTIFSGWSATLEHILEGEQDIDESQLFSKICVDSKVCPGHQEL